MRLFRHMLLDLVIAMVQYLDAGTVEGLYRTILPWLKVGKILWMVKQRPFDSLL